MGVGFYVMGLSSLRRLMPSKSFDLRSTDLADTPSNTELHFDIVSGDVGRR
jgi:hypothetical protein